MRYLFGPGYEERLRTFLASRPLLAFDFDGTLAPLIEQPALADAGPETRHLLSMLAVAHPVVIISGRMRADVERRFANVPLAGVTGNHGLEPWATIPTSSGWSTGGGRSCSGSWHACPGSSSRTSACRLRWIIVMRRISR